MTKNKFDETLPLSHAFKALKRGASLLKAEQTLLNDLRSAKLRTGFYYPAARPLWIEVPPKFWFTLSPNKFKEIRYSPRKKSRPGAIKVGITDFVEELASSLTRTGETYTEAAALAGILSDLVRANARTFAIEILSQDFLDYVKEKEIDINDTSKSKAGETRGRHEMESWRTLGPILAAYVGVRGIAKEAGETHDAIARNVLDFAAKLDLKERCPTAETLAKAVSEMFKHMHKMDPN